MRETLDFDEFYAGTRQVLVAQVFAMVGDLGEAEDAVAEAFARAWQRWRCWARIFSDKRRGCGRWRHTTNRVGQPGCERKDHCQWRTG